MSQANKDLTTSLHDLITGDEDARVCKDIPESACSDQPRNFFAYLFANLLGKIADEIASARLILPWLLASVGAPAAFTGFLVPIREAGVLLPQLVVAAIIRRMAIRKSVWLLGAGLSGVALALMAVATGNLSGSTAGWAILGLLIIFSLARGLCSVSAKDVLGKTVSKGKRGTLMGWSAGISGLAVLAVGIYVEWFAGDAPLAV
ncbi:MAG: MFS transporter, partial [Pseudomonadota bacterium]|nr:MFS transporter [Pseudomonadota bacterium]